MSELFLSNFNWLNNIVETIGANCSLMSFPFIFVFASNVMKWNLFNNLMRVIYILNFFMMLLVNFFFDKLCFSKNIMDRGMRLSQDVSIAKMMLQSFDIVRLFRVVLAHIVLKSCSRTIFHIKFTTLSSSSNL